MHLEILVMLPDDFLCKSVYNNSRKTQTMKGGIRMATQIAATPVIRGSEAKKIYQEANRKPSPKAEVGAKKLSMMFEKMMK